MATCDFCLVALAPELNSDYCIDCYRAFVPEIKIRILQQAFNMSVQGTWKDMDFGVAKQYDDDTMQIQLIGAGNEYCAMPNWIVEFWCKKPGCRNGHMAGGIPKGTPLAAVVAKCKSSHPECDTCSECSSSSETDEAPGISMAVTTITFTPAPKQADVKFSTKKVPSSQKNKKSSSSKSASSLESSKASKNKRSSSSKSKKSASANKKICAHKSGSASKSRDDPFAL